MDDYGDVDVLYVADVPQPEPAADQVVVEVVAAGINPGEIGIRTGALRERWPSTFPSGEGSDFAGTVVAVGAEVGGFAPGDEVLGWSDWRSSHADYVAVTADHLTLKPIALDWIRAGGLFVAGVTAYAAVRAVNLRPGETVAVSGAAGGVGSITVQLAREKGARVIGIAGEHNADWLRSVGVTPVAYGDGLADRLREAAPEAFIDTYGSGYVQLAVEDLGLPVDRIDTVADFPAIGKYGVKGEGSAAGSDAGILAELADLLAWGVISLPIAAVYPLGLVKDAYTELAKHHSRGKIVLSTRLPDDAGRQGPS
jgi:NADPH:quinone reductase-like Zn-dependent oxidoreductase